MGALRVEVAVPVAATIDRAWRLLAAVGRLAEWAPDVAESPSGPLKPGAVRRAKLKRKAYGKEVLLERFVAVMPHGFVYDIQGGIGPLKAIRTTWNLVPAGAGACVLRVHSDLTVAGLASLMPALVRKSWGKQLDRLAHAFRDWAEDPTVE